MEFLKTQYLLVGTRRGSPRVLRGQKERKTYLSQKQVDQLFDRGRFGYAQSDSGTCHLGRCLLFARATYPAPAADIRESLLVGM